eukprot:764875-Hanusia_phi.AAC.2
MQCSFSLPRWRVFLPGSSLHPSVFVVSRASALTWLASVSSPLLFNSCTASFVLCRFAGRTAMAPLESITNKNGIRNRSQPLSTPAVTWELKGGVGMRVKRVYSWVKWG